MAKGKKNKSKGAVAPAGAKAPARKGAAQAKAPVKKGAAVGSAQAKTANAGGSDKGGRIALICFAALALVGLAVGVIAFLVSYINSRPVDYLNDDLSKYIYLSEEDYKSFDATVTVDRVTDDDVENAILQALYKHRDEDPENDGKYLINQFITPGDKVLIYYRGYTLDEDGVKVDFSGGCNFSGSSPSSLEIGSGQFITGFELNLVGHNPRDYSTFKKHTEGEVTAGALVQLTFSAAYPDGTTDVEVSALVSLEDNACDKAFGKGFADFLTGKPVGKLIMAESEDGEESDKAASFVGTDVEGYDGDPVFTDMKVTAVYEVGNNPLTVEAFFPYDYQEESLRSTTAYFDVYVDSAQLYKTPELDDKFITDTLKLTEAELEKYEGRTLVDKWRASLREKLEAEYEEAVELQIEEAMLNHYSKHADVKKLPKGEVDDYYDNYVAKWENEYATRGSGYASLDEYVITQMGLSYYEDWREIIRKDAEAAITDKLAFYYVVAREGLVPDADTLAEEKEALILKYLNAYLEEQGCDRSKYDSDEKYEKAVEGYRTQLLYYYDESYFEENAIYVYAMRTLREYANVTYEN